MSNFTNLRGYSLYKLICNGSDQLFYQNWKIHGPLFLWVEPLPIAATSAVAWEAAAAWEARIGQSEPFVFFFLSTPLPHLSWSFFWGSKAQIIASTVGILAQGTSWAVAVTQAFLTWVRFPLGPWLPWPLASLDFSKTWKSPIAKSALFFHLDFSLFSWKNSPKQRVIGLLWKDANQHQKVKMFF